VQASKRENQDIRRIEEMEWGAEYYQTQPCSSTQTHRHYRGDMLGKTFLPLMSIPNSTTPPSVATYLESCYQVGLVRRSEELYLQLPSIRSKGASRDVNAVTGIRIREGCCLSFESSTPSLPAALLSDEIGDLLEGPQ